ncbi:MAG TPA: GAF domain-containing sensor histidine kinase, partial [Chloroflexaceae bacterium]|nr:GAF domain-containing sensor histidine kinase [Chloroflexaceae bacterium]
GEPDNIPALIYALLPLLLWAAVRFGPGGVSLATTTVMLLAIWQTSNGRGPFLGAAAIENVFNLQAYFLAFAAPLMLLAALIEERRRGATVLVALNAALEGRVAARTRALGQTNRQLAAARDQAVRTVGLLRHEVAERERAEASLQQRVAELEALNQIARALTGWTSLGSGLAAAAPLIRGLLDVATVSVWVEETPGGTLQRALAAGTSGVAGAPALLDEERARLLLRGPALTVAPLAAEDDLVACPCADGGHPGTYPALLVVLRARGEPTGLLCARAARPDRQFPPDQLALAETVGGLLATALDNARLLAEAQAAAAEQERQRLARDLHDSVSQALFAANRTAEVLPLLWELDPEEGQRALRDLSSFTGSALADMRALLLELRPKALIETPLHVTLGHLATVFAGKARVVVEPAIEPAPPLPPHPQLTLYRIAQEALNNVAKHACASRVVVGLAVAPPVEGAVAWAGTVVLTVADDGRGFDPDAAPAGGIGLASLRERAAEIGAELEIVSRPGGGTRVRVAWRQG